MLIAGFQKQSLIDYPGNISSVIFTQGCNFRCGYCHNPNLVLPECFEKTINLGEILAYLEQYKKLLTAVVITGGEPTIQKDLPAFISKIKELGLKVKLDSNGTNPGMLQHLIDESLVDFVAMDIKHILDLSKYREATGRTISKELFLKIILSIETIKNSGIDHEFRTTIVNGLHTLDEIESLRLQFRNNYRIQNFKPTNILDPSAPFSSFSDQELIELN